MLSANALPASLYVVLGAEGRGSGRAVQWLWQILARIPQPSWSSFLAAIHGGKVLVSKTVLQGLKGVSSYVTPFGALCSTLATRIYKAVIKYVNFSCHVQQLCSATVLKWCQNMVHDAVPSNSGGFTAPVPVPVPLLPYALNSTSFNCVWNCSGDLNLGFFLS
jgi:hypothetical protein